MPHPTLPNVSPVNARFALYYTPAEDDPLTRMAARWLGRSAFEREVGAAFSSADPEHLALTAEPRRYGLHATIKAPFRLRAGHSIEALEQAVRDFCAARSPCPIGKLHIGQIGHFFALVPTAPPPSLVALAAQVVEDFEPFRALLNKAELDRRLGSPLDEVETAHVARWGYPYVFDRFRFHMTLTGPVEASRQSAVRRRLEQVFSPVIEADLSLDALSLFVQGGPGSDFTVWARYPLQGRTLTRSDT